VLLLGIVASCWSLLVLPDGVALGGGAWWCCLVVLLGIVAWWHGLVLLLVVSICTYNLPYMALYSSYTPVVL